MKTLVEVVFHFLKKKSYFPCPFQEKLTIEIISKIFEYKFQIKNLNRRVQEKNSRNSENDNNLCTCTLIGNIKKRWNNLKIMEFGNNSSDDNRFENEENTSELNEEKFCNALQTIMNATLAKKIFTCIDNDNDGKITIVAFHRFVEQKHRYDTNEHKMKGERWLLRQLKEIDMKELDKNGRSKIEKSDLKAYFANFGVSEEIIEEVFNEIDTKKYGYITPMEYFLWKDQFNLKKLRHIVSKTVELTEGRMHLTNISTDNDNDDEHTCECEHKQKSVNIGSMVFHDSELQNELTNSGKRIDSLTVPGANGNDNDNDNDIDNNEENENNNAKSKIQHERQTTPMKQMQFALAEEQYERMQLEHEKKKVNTSSPMRLWKKSKNGRSQKEEAKILQYQLAEEKLQQFEQDLTQKRIQFALADERLERIKLAAERDKLKEELERVQNELQEERTEKIQMERKMSSETGMAAIVDDSLRQEIQRLQYELAEEKFQNVDLNRRLSLTVDQSPVLPRDSTESGILKDELKRLQYQLAEEKMENLQLQRKHSQLEDESKKLQYDLAEEKLQNIELTKRRSTQESVGTPVHEELNRERTSKSELEKQKDLFFYEYKYKYKYKYIIYFIKLEEEAKRLQYQLAEEKLKTMDIEKQNASIVDEKKKLQFQLADEKMENIALVRRLSVTPTVLQHIQT
ncbi:hypothetical protein RFI_18972 [Reticulomyxa filosa]|uniref:EF-hand domain-containing protein n=1 Tax=Reticulomyxa filosa TaxID=46433 RepID=X6MXF6_RETFI|nr:hypothetical protein RFI_18972 [Reticulomyxa filosa]|eukprot:ETO18306.1 hypothetical protein RFI_18972 [Reticulomyxa filosa]